MTAWKLQKLVYYCQAWSLVWDERPLFSEKILAWANGPVVRELFHKHRGQFVVSNIQGDLRRLDNNARETIDAVLKHYGKKSAQYLAELTHLEKPWRETRGNLAPGERGDSEITLVAMADYYSSL
ncbi:MAG: DUF4065 domain-containing protein [Candidatus Lernaella stagnicola]|nr:DUF4065 domain-containing protein [Candidatus Lernaella stagnicola]